MGYDSNKYDYHKITKIRLIQSNFHNLVSQYKYNTVGD